jgi:hypothetical protein
MSENNRKFEIYLTILRFLVYKVTGNLKRIYLDIDLSSNQVFLHAYYLENPSQLELELFDDVCTNSKAHLPDLEVVGLTKLVSEFNGQSHDFVVFSVYEEFQDLLDCRSLDAD